MLQRETFAASMAYLQTIYGKSLEPRVLDIYWEHLSAMDESKFLQAMTGIVNDFVPTATVPFPLVPHFLKYCGESAQNIAKTAVMRLKWAIPSVGRYNSVDLGDRALHAIIERWGGWIRVCSWTDDDWQLNQSKFEADYLAAQNSGLHGSEYLAGVTEATNGAGGYSKFVDPPYLVYETDNGRTVKCVSPKAYARIPAPGDRMRIGQQLDDELPGRSAA